MNYYSGFAFILVSLQVAAQAEWKLAFRRKGTAAGPFVSAAAARTERDVAWQPSARRLGWEGPELLRTARGTQWRVLARVASCRQVPSRRLGPAMLSRQKKLPGTRPQIS
jgi:hypothetical protein